VDTNPAQEELKRQADELAKTKEAQRLKEESDRVAAESKRRADELAAASKPITQPVQDTFKDAGNDLKKKGKKLNPKHWKL